MLRLECSSDGGLRLCVTDRYEVAPGSDPRPTFAIATGALRLRLVDDAGVGVPGVQLRWREDSTSRAGGALSDTDGSVARRIEAGTFRVQCLPRSLQSEQALDAFRREHGDDPDALERLYVDLGIVTVLPGDESPRSITLPPGYER